MSHLPAPRKHWSSSAESLWDHRLIAEQTDGWLKKERGLMNKQPFYHRAVILFTATRDIGKDELEEILRNKLRGNGVVAESPEVEEVDAEPGDPADLL